MDFRLSIELQELQAEAETVAADAVARYGRFNDSWLCGFSREFSRELAERKWLGMAWPKEFGGGGRTPLERLIVSEALIAAGAPVAASWFADRQMGPAFIAFGTADQQAEFLPPMLAGQVSRRRPITAI
jgi:alkylation response protein AidB-like acyl-CoA dehydrogenase